MVRCAWHNAAGVGIALVGGADVAVEAPVHADQVHGGALLDEVTDARACE